MIVLLILLDQFTKYIAYTQKPDFDIIGDFLRMQYIGNTGTIFGLFENANFFFMVLAMILCVVIVIYLRKSVSPQSGKAKALWLILAGGIGNLIDRMVRGFVVDFISLKWVGIFNLADTYVVIGVILVIFFEWIEWKKNLTTTQKEK